MHRLLQRSRNPSRVLLSLLALLEAGSIRADLSASAPKNEGAVSRKEVRRALKEAKGEISSSRSLEERAKKLVAESSQLKPSDLMEALDLPPKPAENSEPPKGTDDNPRESSASETLSGSTPIIPTPDRAVSRTPAVQTPALAPQALPSITRDQAASVSPATTVTNPAAAQQTQGATPPPAQSQIIQIAPPEPLKQIPTPVESTGPLGSEKFLVNLNNVSIGEYIRFISRISGKNFVFNEDELNFNVTIISEELTSLDEIMASLMNELRIHGLSLMERGNNIIIHNNPNVNSPATIVPRDGDETIPRNVQIITRVFQLTSFDPAKAKDIITPLLSASAIIEALPETGYLILTDLTSNVEKVSELLVTLDSPLSSIEVAQYQGKNLYVDSLASLAERIIAPLAEEGKKIYFVPFRETNTLFIISTPPLVEKSLTLLKQIDQGAYSGALSFGKGTVSQNPTGFNGNTVGPDGTLYGPDGKPILGPDGKPLNISSFGGALANVGLSGAGGFGGIAGGFGGTADGFGGIAGGFGGIAGALSTEGLPFGHLLSTDFDIYKLQYRKGDQIQQALQSIATSLLDVEARSQAEQGANSQKGAAPSTGLADFSQNELVSAISSVQWLETTNMLVFTGSRAANLKLKSLIGELDIPNEQVLIELLLLDTTIADSLSYGVDWGTRFGGPNVGGAQGFNSLGTPLPTAMNQIPNGILNAASLAQATGFSLGVIGQNIIHCGNAYGSIGALLRSIHSLSDSRVVLNQKIVVEDNQPAEIFVGLNVPFKTQSVANDFGTILTNNFEYRDIGATLKVTPFINQNGLITIQLEQELSTLIASDTSLLSNSVFSNALGSGPTTRKSNTKTTIFVPDGFFIILSGNIQDQIDKERDELPCLGGIPVIGALFSNRTNTDNKRALLMFIKPSLISTNEEIHYQTKRQQDIYHQKTEPKDMWDWEVSEGLEFLNIRNGPCR